MSHNIILLRGLARGSRHWGDFAEQMQAAMPDANVVTIDLAGNGRRFAEHSPLHVDAAVDDIRAQLKNEGLKPPYYLVAMSLGGMIALSWLINNDPAIRDEVASAVIINTSHSRFNPLYQRMRPAALRRVLLSLWMPATSRESVIYRLTINSKGTTKRKKTIREWAQIQRENPVSMVNFYRQLTLARSFNQPLKIDPSHCVLLASVKDKLVNPKCSQKLSKRFGLPIHYHDKAGHDIPFDDPKWVIDHARRQFFTPTDAAMVLESD